MTLGAFGKRSGAAHNLRQAKYGVSHLCLIRHVILLANNFTNVRCLGVTAHTHSAPMREASTRWTAERIAQTRKERSLSQTQIGLVGGPEKMDGKGRYRTAPPVRLPYRRRCCRTINKFTRRNTLNSCAVLFVDREALCGKYSRERARFSFDARDASSFAAS